MPVVHYQKKKKKLPIVAFFFSGFCKKCHHKYPIVAFSKNATIGISIATFRGLYSGGLKHWAYSSVLKMPL